MSRDRVPNLKGDVLVEEASHKHTLCSERRTESRRLSVSERSRQNWRVVHVFELLCVRPSQPNLTYLELTTAMGRLEHPFISVSVIPLSHLNMLNIICCLTL